jgi:predicted nucleic acid-binding protein
MRAFIDTNLWAYRLDRREAEKSERVRGWLAELIAEHEVVISTQVWIELRSVASPKLQPPLSDQRTTALLEALAGFEVVGSDANLILDAH